MAQRLLPAGPDEIFRAAEPVLTRFFGEGAYSLGGGTALAALWRHRHSTDIDLFMDVSAFRVVVMDDGRKRALEDALDRAVRPDFLEVRRGGLLKVLCGEGELGLYVPPSPIKAAPPVDWVHGTSVPLERPATILARKVHGRMIERSDLLLRDLYDLAAASELAPDDLQTVLDSVSDEDRLSLCDNLASLPVDLMSSPHLGRPLINAVLPAHLAENPALCVDIVRQMLDCDGGRNQQSSPSAPSNAPHGEGSAPHGC